ncbi:hypothetical protein ES332_A07G166300v1 [Gossypium tomentosum]|uniref:Uncharacterized protein n=1 Tax=Gossypium tomentosum TaxID=34277 RepID=A0A5D2PTV3_GOSTO|nr:hypothetical protein ES332_A07G166300v1 [Gossypium tomentosum]
MRKHCILIQRSGSECLFNASPNSFFILFYFILFFYFRQKSPPTSTHHSDENVLGFSIKCIEDSLFLDFGCGEFACGGTYGEIDVEGEAFQRNAHVSHRAA